MKKNNQFNNTTSEHDMGKLIFESWGRQRQRILDAATLVHERDFLTIKKSLGLYYAALRSLYDEYYPYIKGYIYDVSTDQQKKYFMVTSSTLVYKQKTEERTEVINILHLCDNLFYNYDAKIIAWKKSNKENNTRSIPNDAINILTKIHRLLHDLGQWNIGIGIRLQKDYSSAAKIRKAI